MTDLEKLNISEESFLNLLDDIKRGKPIIKNINGENKQIGNNHKLYFNNLFLSIKPYTDKADKKNVSISIGYFSVEDRIAISKYNKENNSKSNTY